MNYKKYNDLDINTIKILIIDDDDQVIEVTKFVLEDYKFYHYEIEILEAFSVDEALKILDEQKDIAVALIDIIMDEDDSGLQLIDKIRNELNRHRTRLLIRTGQPGIFPPEDIFLNYDINDYLNKNDLSNERLILSVTSAIRNYLDLLLIENITVQKAEQDKLLLTQSKNAAVGEMIQMITHQWAQPLTVIKMAVDYIKLDLSDQKELENSIKDILSQISYMSITLKDFKNFFSPDKNKTTFNVIDSIQSARNIISKKFINFNFDENAKHLVYGYLNEMSQVFIILFNNTIDGIKANDIEDGAINITFDESDDKLAICVKDNAGGIPEYILKKLFTKYNTSKEEGTGIGLYIAKFIIENEFGGNIEAFNTQSGACFRITLLKHRVEA